MKGEFSMAEPRFGSIEGRKDLFETRLLEVQQLGDFQSEILVATRDPGSANALSPVVKELIDQKIASINILSDGKARDIFSKNCEIEDITPPKTVLETDLHINPDVLLIDPSSEQGIEGYLANTYSEVPMVVVEDYYSSSNEETEKIQQQVKEKLNLKQEDKLITFMSTCDVSIDQIEEVLRNFPNISCTLLAFRKHLRDNASYEEYYSLFDSLGINYLNVEEFSSDEVGAAADLVITTWSTEGLKGIYRRKPTIHLSDSSLLDIPAGLELPSPAVKLGASLGVEKTNHLSVNIQELLDEKSPLRRKLFQNMEHYYPADGKNPARVADQVRMVIESKKEQESKY
jgi:hypothetical protein